MDGTSRRADPGGRAAGRAPGWAVVLPVKRLAAGKSRLRGAVTGVRHERLALALALDTAAAALASPAVARVVAVTDDPEAAAALAALGAHTVPDPPGAGLNAAFAHGASLAGGAPVAALAGDLPALRPADLAAALRAAEVLQARAPTTGGAGARGFAADADGTGTVLLTAPAGGHLDPRFGPGSAAAHAASGAVPLNGAWPGLRRDVDTAADLAAAAALGLGPHTAELLRYGAHMLAVMQGTVATYDPVPGPGRSCSTTAPSWPIRPRRSTLPACGCCGSGSGYGSIATTPARWSGSPFPPSPDRPEEITRLTFVPSAFRMIPGRVMMNG